MELSSLLLATRAIMMGPIRSWRLYLVAPPLGTEHILYRARLRTCIQPPHSRSWNTISGLEQHGTAMLTAEAASLSRADPTELAISRNEQSLHLIGSNVLVGKALQRGWIRDSSPVSVDQEYSTLYKPGIHEALLTNPGNSMSSSVGHLC